MGIDLKNAGRTKHGGRKVLKSPNPQLKLLTTLYSFLARRTDSKFNGAIAKRLITPRRFRGPLSLNRVVEAHKANSAKQNTVVVVGTVTNDLRTPADIPAMKVCALRFSELARSRIVKAGGECLSFDQLALQNPTGSKTTLLRGPIKSRKADKHFGKAPGTPKSSAMPYVRSKGRKFERARGKR